MSGRSLNKVMIIGNLTRDPELRYTPNGAAVIGFGVATNREYTPANSTETVNDTEFHNITAWSKLAELCAKLLTKGDKVYIEGRLQTRDWVDEQSGKKMYRTEIIASEMILLSSGKKSGEFTESSTQYNDLPPAEDTSVSKAETVIPVDDEIPF